MRPQMLERRRFLQRGVALAGVAMLSGCGLLPSSTSRVSRVGYFAENCECASGTEGLIGPAGVSFVAFRNALRTLGYEVGTNLDLVQRVADVRQEDTYLQGAAALAALHADVLVASGTAPAVHLVRAVAAATRGSVPVVFIDVGAPVEIGLVESLARPGRNVTGFASFNPELASKRLELLKDAAPRVALPAVFWNPADPEDALELATMSAAALRFGLELRPVEVRDQAQVEAAVVLAARNGADAIIVATKIATGVAAMTALQAGLPLVSRRPEGTTYTGGLLAFGVNTSDLYRRAASQVARILGGAKAAELPVEQPSKFDFVINLKTAEKLGFAIPSAVLAQATEVVQ